MRKTGLGRKQLTDPCMCIRSFWPRWAKTSLWFTFIELPKKRFDPKFTTIDVFINYVLFYVIQALFCAISFIILMFLAVSELIRDPFITFLARINLYNYEIYLWNQDEHRTLGHSLFLIVFMNLQSSFNVL